MTNVHNLELAARRLEQTNEATHISLAEQLVDVIKEESGAEPVYALGAFYSFDKTTKLWAASTLENVAIRVGGQFRQSKVCKKASDYHQIAKLIATLCAKDNFFAEAPAGIAAGGEFYRVSDSGDISYETLAAGHRQRMSVASSPDFKAAAPLLEMLLKNAFGDDAAGVQQKALLQMALGAALTCTLWRYRTVLMLYGASSTGKSTLLEIIKNFFPADRVGATSPLKWDSDYHMAGLAGRALNLVGELDANKAIEGGVFKAVTGGDVVEARNPNYRTFSFVCIAGHVFNCNRLPPTRDKSDAFFRRWRIVEFTNSVKMGDEIIGLAEKIFAEEQGAVLAWLLSGAADLAKRGSFPETENHRRLIQYWRAGNNSALQFVLDTEYIELKAPPEPLSGMDVFTVYKRWASSVGVKPLGRNSFYEALGDGGGRLGITVADDRDGTKRISGIGLKAASQQVLSQ